MKVIVAIFFLGFFFLFNTTVLHAQQLVKQDKSKAVFQQKDASRRELNQMRVMFYNVENLFNPNDDSTKADEEYMPGGMRGWTFNRMKRKQINIAKVVLAVGGWDPPEIIGLCEVEDRIVLYGLTNDTPLKNFGYKIVHLDSPDPRGIDVAMLYRPEKFRLLTQKMVHVRFPFDTASRTRDILYVKGIACKKDTMHIFVNHWPSKFGGALTTIPKRKYVASVVKRLADSLLTINPDSKILIMGDLNDTPFDESVNKVLGAKMDSVNLKSNDLYNMLAGAGVSWNHGTIKFREEWETIDHMIVSVPMLKYTTPSSMHIFDAPFLLQDDEAWFGKKPFRTYYGAKYIGGFSDHLPVYMDFTF